MNITKDQKIEAYKKLTESQKEFLASDTFTESFKSIGNKYNLHIDKIGALGDILFSTLIGLIKVPDLRSELTIGLNVDGGTLESIMKDVNERIFVTYRSLLIQDSAEKESENIMPPAETPQKPVEKPLNIINPSPQTSNRALIMPGSQRKILAEIENPEPVKPILPVPQPELDRIKRGPQKPWETTKESIARDFIGNKLTQPVNNPVERSNLVEKKPIDDKASRYSGDPYREPAN